MATEAEMPGMAPADDAPDDARQNIEHGNRLKRLSQSLNKQLHFLAPPLQHDAGEKNPKQLGEKEIEEDAEADRVGDRYLQAGFELTMIEVKGQRKQKSDC